MVPAKAGIANDIYEETNNTEITLCSDNDPDIIEEEVNVTYTGIRPETIDKVIQATERGELIPEIGGNPIPRRTQEIDQITVKDKVSPKEDLQGVLPTVSSLWEIVCFTESLFDNETTGKPTYPLIRPKNKIKFTHKSGETVEYTIYFRVRKGGGETPTFTSYKEQIIDIEENFISAIESDFKGLNDYTKTWELVTISDDRRKGEESDYNDPQFDFVKRTNPDFFFNLNNSNNTAGVCIINTQTPEDDTLEFSLE